jgi:hypothetical protein
MLANITFSIFSVLIGMTVNIFFAPGKTEYTLKYFTKAAKYAVLGWIALTLVDLL